MITRPFTSTSLAIGIPTPQILNHGHWHCNHPTPGSLGNPGSGVIGWQSKGHNHYIHPRKTTSDQTACQGVPTGRMHIAGHQMDKGDTMGLRWSLPDSNTNTTSRNPKPHSQVLRTRPAMLSSMATAHSEMPSPGTCWKHFLPRNLRSSRPPNSEAFSCPSFHTDSCRPQTCRLDYDSSHGI